MRIEWDEQKERNNWRKHRVHFDVAARVFDDHHAVTAHDRVVDGEVRRQTIGVVPISTGGAMMLLVAHTAEDEEDNEVVRLISARKADAYERKTYESAQTK
ncbi:MAG: BrnT family toxin [Acidobacteria bacterium]|nr:BrnT family toxin [Acidobacteriota bacterium]